MGSPSFKRFTVEMQFCGVDPGLISVVTNAQIYADYVDDPIGFTVPEGTIDSRFGLELWTGLSGAACEPGADTASGYMLLPLLNAGVMSDISIDGENAVTFGMTGAFTRGGNAWGVGGYNGIWDNGTVITRNPSFHFDCLPVDAMERWGIDLTAPRHAVTAAAREAALSGVHGAELRSFIGSLPTDNDVEPEPTEES
jgi:hypothetical protein